MKSILLLVLVASSCYGLLQENAEEYRFSKPVDMTKHRIRNAAPPLGALDVANKEYVDANAGSAVDTCCRRISGAESAVVCPSSVRAGEPIVCTIYTYGFQSFYGKGPAGNEMDVPLFQAKLTNGGDVVDGVVSRNSTTQLYYATFAEGITLVSTVTVDVSYYGILVPPSPLSIDIVSNVASPIESYVACDVLECTIEPKDVYGNVVSDSGVTVFSVELTINGSASTEFSPLTYSVANKNYEFTVLVSASGNYVISVFLGANHIKFSPVSFWRESLGEESNPAASCKEILEVHGSITEGVYYLNPSGTVYDAYCSSDGWTLCFSDVPRGKGVALNDINDFWITNWKSSTSWSFTQGNRDQGSTWGNFCPAMVVASQATKIKATVYGESNVMATFDECTLSANWFIPNTGHQALSCTGTTQMSAMPKDTFQNYQCTQCCYMDNTVVPNTTPAGWNHNYYGTTMIVKKTTTSAYSDNGGVHWAYINENTLGVGNGGDVHCGSNNAWCYEEYWYTTAWKKSMQLWVQ